MLPQLIHIWQLLVSHPALFYSYRHQFVAQIINFFGRLSRFPNTALENRTLAVALAALIIEWEVSPRRRRFCR